MSGARVRLSGWVAAVTVWAGSAAGCGVEWFDADAGPGQCEREGECDGDEVGACALDSARVDACEPAALAELGVSATGLPWPEPGAYIGVADCEVTAVDEMPGMTAIQLACVHIQGDPIEPLVTVALAADALDASSAAHVGRSVRLTVAATISDEDVPSALFIKLARPADGALLLAATEGWGRVTPPEPLLAEVDLTPADWYAPLTVALVGGACTASPAPCAGTRERAAVSFAAPGRDPAAVQDRHAGRIDGGWRAIVGAAELYSDPLDCVDNQPRSDLVVVATAGCPGPQ
jgi:hypothetical protein